MATDCATAGPPSGSRDQMDGYLSRGYAQSLREVGEPRELPRSRGWILQRQVPGFPYRDAMGCYPLFSCADWSVLSEDVADLRGELVTLSLVTDPFGAFEPETLQEAFDIVRPFKRHYIAELDRPLSEFVSKHHRQCARHALRSVNVERCEDPARYLDEWTQLYGTLIVRHGISGIRAFSRSSFEAQLAVPGLVAFRATFGDSTVGMLLCYVQGDVAYSHLTALSPAGYRSRASYAIFYSALEYFHGLGLRWMDLGAGAGLNGNGDDGLNQFKRGWSGGERMAYFCGQVLDPAVYRQILGDAAAEPGDYFPAYRKGEFA